jgi:hypothetical protein
MSSDIAPPPVPESGALTTEAVVQALDDVYTLFKKSIAAFNTMDRAARTVMKKLRPGEYPQGSPLLKHSGSANGVDVMDSLICDLDSKDADDTPYLDDKAKGYILSTIALVHHRKSAELLCEMERAIQYLKPLFVHGGG